MAYATHISLKVKLDEDIRRFSVQKDISFADLHSLISKHFVLAPESVQIKYIDDEEELITLGSDLELQEAKRLQPTVLRLNVYDVKPRRCASSDQPLPQLMAVFVRDVTVPDGTSVTANVKFQKVWRVKNTGTATWPKGGVVLKMVDPNDGQLRVLAVGTITRAVGPDEETDIGVELQAPSRPGRCVQYWRLFAEDGSAFGSRLWVDITVVQDNAAAEKELAEQAEAMRLAEEEEQQLRLQREEEERRRLEEEAMLRKLQEEEKARYEEELARQMEELKRQLEEDERRKREEEKAAAAAAAEAEAAALQKKREEEEARRQAEEEARRQAEEEARRQAAAALKKKQEEEEAKKRQLYSKYPGQLTALAEMGFTNVEHNVKLLDKHKGSLDLALEALLSGQ